MPRAKQKLTTRRSTKKSTESKATKETIVSEVKDTKDTKETKESKVSTVATEKDKKAPAKRESRVYREKAELDPQIVDQIRAELTDEIKKQIEFLEAIYLFQGTWRWNSRGV